MERYKGDIKMYNTSAEFKLNILVKGRPVTEYKHIDGNVYIEGRPGSEYEIEFSNLSTGKVMIVPAVDGLSVMDGKPAGINSGGYVVDIAATIKIPGWRLNQREVAKFEFGRVGKSYAVQSGQDATNVGVIGLMVFRDGQPFKSYETPYRDIPWYPEPRHPRPYNPWDGSPWDPYKDRPYKPTPIWYEGGQYREPPMLSSGDVTRTAVSSSASSNSQSIGTEFGDVQWFETTGTWFKKLDPNNPDEIMVAFYDNARGLEKRGIVVERKKRYSRPDPFPTYNGCLPPSGWKR